MNENELVGSHPPSRQINVIFEIITSIVFSHYGNTEIQCYYNIMNFAMKSIFCFVLEFYSSGNNVPSEKKFIFLIFFQKTPRVERASDSERTKLVNEGRREASDSKRNDRVSVSFEKI